MKARAGCDDGLALLVDIGCQSRHSEPDTGNVDEQGALNPIIFKAGGAGIGDHAAKR